MNFYLCFVRTRKKLDKYFKVNKIRNKQIIDIRKIIDEEKIDMSNVESKAFFKVLIWNKIKMAKDKDKDIYYIPNFNNPSLSVPNLLNLKPNLLNEEENQFNLLCFYEEFIGTNWLIDVLENLDTFNNSQIIKDY